ARASLISSASCDALVRTANTVCSPFGTFGSTYSVTAQNNLVPRNYLTMPGLFSINMRVSKTIGFGGKKSQAVNPMQGGGGMPSPGMMGMSGGGGGGHGPGGPGGGGMGGPGGGGMGMGGGM